MGTVANVYYSRVDPDTPPEAIGTITHRLLDAVVERERVALERTVPLKVHFGEPGNVTFIRPENYDGVIDYLDERGITTQFMETTVLYGGQRYTKALHLKTAKKHGFTRVPVVIADGDHGEAFYEVTVNLKHFDRCKIAAAFADYDQLIVIAHFKGHALAGFAGAIKQLSMGHASKGGKLAMHMGVKPHIRNWKCNKCHLCEKKCAAHAITIDDDGRSFIDHEKCVGCGACVAVCPHKAVKLLSLKAAFTAIRMGAFREKLVEYAYAAQKGKQNIYLNYAMNITAGCDCEGKKMKVLMDDIGIFASTDPVAIDRACYDMVRDAGKRFRGKKTFAYAEKVGLGTTDYVLTELGPHS